jgi:hypothetical protein
MSERGCHKITRYLRHNISTIALYFTIFNDDQGLSTFYDHINIIYIFFLGAYLTKEKANKFVSGYPGSS